MSTFGGKRIRIVRFEECDLEPTDAEFYKEFGKYNEISWWIVLLFLMTAFSHFGVKLDDSLEELGSFKEVSCFHDGLETLNWPVNEIIDIFYPEMRLACLMYDYNLTEFQLTSYEEALEKVKTMKEKPKLIYCSDPINASFSWDRSFFGTCKGYIHKQLILGSRFVGVSLGSIILGILSDVYGRKYSLMISTGLYFFGTTTQILFNNFFFVRVTTAIRGIGRAGIDQALLLLLLEHAGKANRPYLIIYSMTLGPIGLLTGVNIKRNLHGYCKELRFILVIPSLMLLFYLWYVSESPRWYLSYCRKKKAWLFLNKLGTPIDQLHFLPDIKLTKWKVVTENMMFLFTFAKFIKIMVLAAYLLTFQLFTKFSKKKYVTLQYLRPYSHHHVLCSAKLFSYMCVLLPIMMLRRRLALFWFHSLICIQLLIIIFTSDVNLYIVSGLLFLCIHGVKNILTLYLMEVFPTCVRGTSFGLIKFVAVTCYAVYFSYEQTAINVTTLTEHLLFFFASIISLPLIWSLPEIKLEELPDYKRYRRDYKVA